MDNKKPETYEDTHKKLTEALQEACSTKEFGDYKIPDIDLSFLNEDYICDEYEELPMYEKSENRKNFHFSRFSKVAAIILILLLSINIIMLATDSNDSYGKKGLLHRISKGVAGMFTDEEYISTDEIIESYCITSEEHIGKILEIFPDIYIPYYLFNEFKLEKMSVKFYASGDIRAEYIFAKSENKLRVGLSYTIDERETIYSSTTSDIETIELDDRIICIYKDKVKDEYVADIYFEDCYVDISGLNDSDELIKVAESLEKPEQI